MMGTPTRMLQASRLTVVFGPLVLISVVSALLGLPLTALIAAQGLSGEILTKMFGMTFGAIALGLAPVSYTHLDVYKRQGLASAFFSPTPSAPLTSSTISSAEEASRKDAVKLFFIRERARVESSFR